MLSQFWRMCQRVLWGLRVIQPFKVNDCIWIGFQLRVRFTVLVSLKSEFKKTLWHLSFFPATSEWFLLKAEMKCKGTFCYAYLSPHAFLHLTVYFVELSEFFKHRPVKVSGKVLKALQWHPVYPSDRPLPCIIMFCHGPAKKQMISINWSFQ